MKSFGEMLGGKSTEKDEPAEEKEEGEGDLSKQAKMAAIKALFSASKSGDHEGGLKAMQAFYDAC
jgi:hypothetical protein